MTQEIWKPIIFENCTDKYFISNQGNIKKGDDIAPLNIKEGQEIKYKFYLGDKKTKTKSVHILVATEFLDNPNNYTCIKHKNGNLHDNRVENLEWISKTIVSKKSHESGQVCSGVPIEQYSKDGTEFIKRFSSVREASKELDIPEKNFNTVLSGKKFTLGDFHFKYAPKQQTPLNGFENIIGTSDYMINKNGQVYTVKQQTILEHKVKDGFLCVYIDRKRAYIHTLLAKQFIENPNNFKRVKHIDGDKMNNNVDNLKWY
jgi:hypothetical protein